MVQAALKASGDRRFDQLRYVLCDWAHSERSEISLSDVEKLVACIQAMAQTNPHVVNAVVLPRGETGQALVAFYVALTEDLPWRTEYFHDEADARNWINDAFALAS
jgi:hypothetical protein